METYARLQIAGALVAVGFLVYHLYNHVTAVPLPPGPKSLPFIGNPWALPPKGQPEYRHWLKFKDTYGPISSINVFGQRMIIIHGRQAVEDVLEKTSLKTSGRPLQPFAGECGLNKTLPGQQYTAESKQHRKLIHQQLGTAKASSAFHDIQDVESRRLLLRALTDPENLIEHFKKEACAIILKITYGYAIEPHTTDALASMIERVMNNLSTAFVPLYWMVDIFPWLGRLPDGFPGTGYRTIARSLARLTQSVCDAPFDFVQKGMAEGTNRTSYTSSCITRLSKASGGTLTAWDENIIKQTAAIMYGAGADTTISTLSSVVLAMMMFPEVQRKAQREIDDVVGTDRLPDFSDRPRLPYINALVKESLRWFPVIPIGTSHAVDEEFVYEGKYRFPKGALILPTIRWLLHDPEVHPDPEVFEPERFMAPRNEPDPSDHCFGYGRRICPGQYLANDSLFITIARLIATFNISKPLDKDGRELDVRAEPMPSAICHPAEFPFTLAPRSDKHAELIRTVEVEHPWEESDAARLNPEMMDV